MRGRKRWLLAAAVLSVLAAAALWLLLRPAASLPQPGQTLLHASQGLDAIQVQARLDTDTRALSVTQTMTLWTAWFCVPGPMPSAARTHRPAHRMSFTTCATPAAFPAVRSPWRR